MKGFIFGIVLILLCSIAYAQVSLTENGVSDNLVVKKIFSDKVLVTIDGEEAILKTGSIVKNVKLVAINSNPMDGSYSKAVFDLGSEVEDEAAAKPIKENLVLVKNDGKEVLGHLIIFVKASDNVAFLNIDGKEYQAKKGESIVIENTVINVNGLVHNSLDDKFDKVMLEVGRNIKSNKNSMLSVTGNVVKDYGSKSFNAIRQVPITGEVVSKTTDVGSGVVSKTTDESVSFLRRLLNWMLGK